MSHYKSGVLFTVVGALLWGISGTSGQFLLQQRGLTSGWLVAVRMLMAGLILLMLCYKKEKEAIFRVWKDKRDRRDLFLFALWVCPFANTRILLQSVIQTQEQLQSCNFWLRF